MINDMVSISLEGEFLARSLDTAKEVAKNTAKGTVKAGLKYYVAPIAGLYGAALLAKHYHKNISDI